MRALACALSLALLALPVEAARAADASRVKAATSEVEQGARKIGAGQVGQGVEDTAKGIGRTVVEGAKYAGDKLRESGKAAEPKAKSSWTSLKESATSFGQSVRSFFARLFSG